MTLLIIIGIIEVFRLLSLIILRTKDNSSVMIIVPISGKDEKAEFLLRNAVAKIKWLGAAGSKKIICLDINMDPETRKICEIIKNEYEFIEICCSEELNKVFYNNKNFELKFKKILEKK